MRQLARLVLHFGLSPVHVSYSSAKVDKRFDTTKLLPDFTLFLLIFAFIRIQFKLINEVNAAKVSIFRETAKLFGKILTILPKLPLCHYINDRFAPHKVSDTLCSANGFQEKW